MCIAIEFEPHIRTFVRHNRFYHLLFYSTKGRRQKPIVLFSWKYLCLLLLSACYAYCIVTTGMKHDWPVVCVSIGSNESGVAEGKESNKEPYRFPYNTVLLCCMGIFLCFRVLFCKHVSCIKYFLFAVARRSESIRMKVVYICIHNTYTSQILYSI